MIESGIPSAPASTQHFVRRPIRPLYTQWKPGPHSESSLQGLNARQVGSSGPVLRSQEPVGQAVAAGGSQYATSFTTRGSYSAGQSSGRSGRQPAPP
ncbi:hypothetical protein JYT86_00160 [bacterium AH-315-N03]|nr:hypothetical protein [bacterium AH-315-N03]